MKIGPTEKIGPMKIGIQTRLWGAAMNRTRLPALLEQAARAGYDGVEIGAQHLDLDHPAQFRRLLDDCGLGLAALHIAGMFDQPEVALAALNDAPRAIEFAAQAGAAFVTVSGREGAAKPLAEIEAYAAVLNRLGEACRLFEMRLCHHNHYWEIVNDYGELHAICRLTDPQGVSLCLDLGWAQRASGDALAVARTFADRIGYCHLRDAAGDDWAALGQGEVDFAGLSRLIPARPFTWQVVEAEPPAEGEAETPEQTAAALRRAVRELTGW